MRKDPPAVRSTGIVPLFLLGVLTHRSRACTGLSGYPEPTRKRSQFPVRRYSGGIRPSGAIWDRMLLRETNCIFHQLHREYPVEGTRSPLDSNGQPASVRLYSPRLMSLPSRTKLF